MKQIVAVSAAILLSVTGCDKGSKDNAALQEPGPVTSQTSGFELALVEMVTHQKALVGAAMAISDEASLTANQTRLKEAVAGVLACYDEFDRLTDPTEEELETLRVAFGKIEHRYMPRNATNLFYHIGDLPKDVQVGILTELEPMMSDVDRYVRWEKLLTEPEPKNR